MLTWASPFSICCFLDNHAYGQSPHSFECLLAAGAVDSIQANAGNAFQHLKDFASNHRDWLFGHFAYGLTKETEPSHSSSDLDPGNPGASTPARPADPVNPDQNLAPDLIGFPDLYFFVPEILIQLNPDSIRIGSFNDDQEAIWQEILHTTPSAGAVTQAQAAAPLSPAGAAGSIARTPEAPAGATPASQTAASPAATLATSPGATPAGQTGATHAVPIAVPTAVPPGFTPRFSREEYLATVGSLRQHILRGDCYEINFCQEFFSHPASIDPWQTWWSLSQASPNPFAAFYRLDERFLLCASPERYLKKTGTTLLSQPIKGTSPRVPDDPAADRASRDDLYRSPKDRSENVMVVDLVRNDLSKICLPDTVRVEELYGIYPFPQVYQMISTIRGELPPGTHWLDAIQATFPMGSMTGAPKNRVVELIERYERTPRGLFSGAIGYITPEEDFDFNVVIRSLLYNRENNYLSYLVGSGITFYSDPEAEYEECLIKAEGIKKALGNA